MTFEDFWEENFVAHDRMKELLEKCWNTAYEEGFLQAEPNKLYNTFEEWATIERTYEESNLDARLSTCTNEKYQQFILDMVNADLGSKLQWYNGRMYYKGPAIIAQRNEEQSIIQATNVKLQKDNMGLDYIFYPE